MTEESLAKFHPWIQPAVVDYVAGMIRELKELEARLACKNEELIWSDNDIVSIYLELHMLEGSIDSLRWKLLLWGVL